MFGVAFREVYRGSFYLLDKPLEEKPIVATFEMRREFFPRAHLDHQALLRGSVDAEGLCAAGAISGRIALKRRERRLGYAFDVESTDVGASSPSIFRFVGERDLNVIWAHEALTLLSGSLFDATGNEIGMARLRYAFRYEARQTLRSIRVVTPTLREVAAPIGAAFKASMTQGARTMGSLWNRARTSVAPLAALRRKTRS